MILPRLLLSDLDQRQALFIKHQKEGMAAGRLGYTPLIFLSEIEEKASSITKVQSDGAGTVEGRSKHVQTNIFTFDIYSTLMF